MQVKIVYLNVIMKMIINLYLHFKQKKQKKLIKSMKIMCLNSIYRMNYHRYYFFTLVICYPKTGSEYLVVFLIIKFKCLVILIKWLNYLKLENEIWKSNIFMINNMEEEIKTVEACFSNSIILLCHFYVLCS